MNMRSFLFTPFLLLLTISIVNGQTNSYPTSGNVRIFGADEPWTEGVVIVKPVGYGGIRLARINPTEGSDYNGNWAIGYTNVGNDFSISTNNNGTQYNGVFHISNSTRNIGIGTTAPVPNARLDIQGGGLNIGGSGNLDATLHIKTAFGVHGRLTQMSPSVNNKPALNLIASKDATGNDLWWSWGVLTSGTFAFQPSYVFGGSTGFFVDRIGNVGIGSPSPNKKLTVNGTIYGKEVLVDLNVPGPDYVFEKDYNLPSLEEVNVYIEKNKHLPEVPSAKEMEANGINVGEMNMILLKKVEELTLYLIDANKKLAEIDSLKKELAAIKEKQ